MLRLGGAGHGCTYSEKKVVVVTAAAAAAAVVVVVVVVVRGEKLAFVFGTQTFIPF